MPFGGSLAAGVQYQGDQGARTLQISASRNLPITSSGEEIFNTIRAGAGSAFALSAAGNSGTARAMDYTLRRWDALARYVEDGAHPIDNNPIENAIRSIALGRKNWLFSQSSTGAKSMAIIMSILETAKQNGLDQFKYINYLLDKLPNELSLLDTQRLEAYLPWAENVQLHCK